LTGELFRRHPSNPILTATDWPHPVNAVFNPGAVDVNGETVVVARVEDLRGISHLYVARSKNGIDGWEIDVEPLLSPRPGIETEQWGFEDARVVWVPELDRYVVTCTAYGPAGPAVYLAKTADFGSIERVGIVQEPDDKNAALLPRQIDGKWILFHRKKSAFQGSGGDVQISRSTDLTDWSPPEVVLQARDGAWWDSLRIGLGPPPLLTHAGWLLIYHGVKETVAGTLYRVGLALLDLENPTRVLARLPEWVLSPLAPYERIGDVPNTVFPCGAVYDDDTAIVRLYYGAADTSVCLATARLDDLLDALLQVA
jgi:beta-1,2-mannobiose phosphorylase / 1,2-beta-oligomannan phosphorylase